MASAHQSGWDFVDAPSGLDPFADLLERRPFHQFWTARATTWFDAVPAGRPCAAADRRNWPIILHYSGRWVRFSVYQP